MSIKVYKYGMLAPISNADEVKDQMRKGHRYQNNLIAIEKWRREELRLIEAKHSSIAHLEHDFSNKLEEYSKIDKDQKKLNSDARQKVKITELTTARKAAKIALKNAETALKNARKSLKDDVAVKELKAKINKEALERRKPFRADKDNCPWFGTYMLIEQAIDLTKAMPFYDGVKPNDPRFKRWDGSGQLGIQQMPKGKDGTNYCHVSEAFGEYNSFQILPCQSLPVKKNGQPRKVGSKDLRTLRIKIGTDKNKLPIYADFPFVYHRPLPVGGKISQVKINCENQGPKQVWTVAITVNDCPARKDNPKDGVVAFDLGWRDKDTGITIATWKGSDGQKGEVIVDNPCLSRLRKVKEIKSVKDKEFNQVKSDVCGWLRDNSIDGKLAEEVKTIALWKSHNKMVRLERLWKINRQVNDQIIFDKLTKWRYHDHHLYSWLANQSVRAIGRRNELFKTTARTLARRYQTAVFENIDISNMAKAKIASTNRQLTGPGFFRSFCKNAFVDQVEVNAINSTRECNGCKNLCEKTSALQYMCPGCGAEIQRDENAASNLLNRGLTKIH